MIKLKEIMHVILKYNDNVYNVDTIKEHKDVLETNGKVICQHFFGHIFTEQFI